MTITDEQKQQLQNTTLHSGQNAWDYVQEWKPENHYWVAVGILNCIRKGYQLNTVGIDQEMRDLKRGKIGLTD